LETLGPRPDDDVVRSDRDTVFLAIIRCDRLAKRRQPHGGAVVRLSLVNGLLAGPQCRLRARERTVADLQLDDVFALRLESASHGENIKRRLAGETAGELAEGDRRGRDHWDTW